MHDPQVRPSTVIACLFGALALGLLVGAWWLPYLGWAAVMCGQGFVNSLVNGYFDTHLRIVRNTIEVTLERGTGRRPPDPSADGQVAAPGQSAGGGYMGVCNPRHPTRG